MGQSKIYHIGHSELNTCKMLTILWIAPKKTKGEKMDLGTFLTDSSMLRSSRRTSGDVIATNTISSPGVLGR